MWRRSWLSREVLLFGAFSGVAAAYAGALWFGLPGGVAVGALTVAAGARRRDRQRLHLPGAGSRPAWNTWYTLLQFNFTAARARAALRRRRSASGDAWWLAPARRRWASRSACCIALRFLRLIASDSLELRGTARLLSTVLRRALRRARARCSSLGGVVLPLVAGPAGEQEWLFGGRAAFAAGAGSWRWPARSSAATCSSSAWCRSTWPRPMWRPRGRPHEPEAAARTRHAAPNDYRYARRSRGRLHVGAEGAATAGWRPPAATARWAAACSSA